MDPESIILEEYVTEQCSGPPEPSQSFGFPITCSLWRLHDEEGVVCCNAVSGVLDGMGVGCEELDCRLHAGYPLALTERRGFVMPDLDVQLHASFEYGAQLDRKCMISARMAGFR
jgi:hypothetical protein